PPFARIKHFTVNFTITNLLYRPALGNPNSKKFNATKNALTYLLDHMLKNSSINPAYTGCTVQTLRYGAYRDDTGLDAVCSYKNNSSIATFDREKVYQELSNMTKGVTKLGHYSLEKNSLYVNG
ncbi:MUC16 protein, partial [Nothocercus julius]|nr:MUC16 protein [Nothocercus julius]